MFLFFQNSTNGIEKMIGDSLRAHPENLFYDTKDVKQKLMTRKYALLQVSVVRQYGEMKD